MTAFLTVADNTFSGSAYVRFQNAAGVAWDIYPEGRISPSAAWAQLADVVGSGLIVFAISAAKKLTVISTDSNFSIIFSTSALASEFGFNNTTTAGTVSVLLTADTAINAFEVSHINASFSETSTAETGHGSGGPGAASRSHKIEAVGTRANLSAFVAGVEQDGFVSLSDSVAGGVPWTFAIQSIKYRAASSNLARLELSGIAGI